MRRVLLAVALTSASVLLLGAPGESAAQNYAATLDGLQEVPPNPSPATGSGSFTLDAAKMLHFNIVFSGLLAPETASHIHGPAPRGVNAGVIFPLPLGSPKVGTVGPLTPVQEVDLNAGLLYVNIHSQLFPGGEIRGQIEQAVAVDGKTWGAIKALYGQE
jgi:hypothetical protein